MKRLICLSAMALALATPVAAQEPGGRPACASIDDTAVPPALAGWTQRTAVVAAATARQTGKAAVPLGQGVDAQLKRIGEVDFPVLPAKPGGSVSYGGLYELRISEPGDYQVSLGSGAWIEVGSGKTVVESTAHAPGPACTSLRKTVVFPLKAGRYILEITGNGDPGLPLMVSRVAK